MKALKLARKGGFVRRCSDGLRAKKCGWKGEIERRDCKACKAQGRDKNRLDGVFIGTIIGTHLSNRLSDPRSTL